ncbi:MAG: hypothetical protein M3096_10415 [Actinomycetia bacterium]|nr:hypothetical protein [Actinomycetes bacterium]
MTKGTALTHGMIGGGSVSQRWGLATVALVAVMAMTSCSSSGEEEQTSSTVVATTTVTTGCADVVAATIDSSGDTYRVSATILSADTGWDKYADAWEVRSPEGAVLGTRILAHPHVDEQPFTRSLDGVDIPAGITEVEIAARDLVVGFCGETVTIVVPGR